MLKKLNVTEVDILKIDVEGAEPEVIEGASEYLLNGRFKHIILEWNPESWTGKRKELLQKIEKNYTVYRLVMSPFLIRKIEGLSQGFKNEVPENLYLRLN